MGMGKRNNDRISLKGEMHLPCASGLPRPFLAAGKCVEVDRHAGEGMNGDDAARIPFFAVGAVRLPAPCGKHPFVGMEKPNLEIAARLLDRELRRHVVAPRGS